MTSNVKVGFGVVKDELSSSLKGQTKKSKELGKELKGVAREYDRAGSLAKKALRESESAQDRLNLSTKGLKRLLDANKISQQEYTRAIKHSQSIQGKSGRGLRESKSLLGSMKSMTAEIAMNYAGIGGAILAGNAALQGALDLEKRRLGATRDEVAARKTFVLLDSDNAKQRIQSVEAVASSEGFGVDSEERRILWNTAQSLESALGPEEATSRRGLRAVVSASEGLSVPLDTVRKLMLAGKAQGQVDAASFISGGYSAGAVSNESAQVIGTAAAEMGLFEDKAFAFAVAGKMGDHFGAELRPKVKNVATGLSRADRKKLGIGEGASQQEIMAAIVGAGIRDVPGLKTIGIDDQEQQMALLYMATGYQDVLSDIQSIRKAMDDKGFIKRTVAEVEAKDPATRLDREFKRGIVQQYQRDISPQAIGRGIARQKLGTSLINNSLFDAALPMTDDQGQLTVRGAGTAAVEHGPGLGAGGAGGMFGKSALNLFREQAATQKEQLRATEALQPGAQLNPVPPARADQ